MTFPLYGESYGALAAQQQNYDQQANAINAANRAAFMQAADREAEMAFRAREMANRDALNAAQQQESRFRFGVERALQERSRADQLAANQARLQEQRFQFGKQLEQDKARMDLEKARVAGAEGVDADEEAMLYASQLEPMVSALEQAAAQKAAAQAEIGRIQSGATRAGLTRPVGITGFRLPGGRTEADNVRVDPWNTAFKAAQKALVDSERAEQKVRSVFERNLSNLENLGLKRGFKVDRTGRRIVTPSGEFRFGGGAASISPVMPARPVLRVTQSGEVLPVTQEEMAVER